MVIIFAAFLGALLFLLQRVLYANLWSRGVSVFFQFEKEIISTDQQVNLLEIVENHKRLPLPSLKVKFQCSRHLEFSDSQNGSVTDRYYRNDLFSVMPYQRITRTHCITCRQRGYYGIDGIDLVGVDLFFSEEMTDTRNSNAELYVIPKPLSAKALEPAFCRISGEVAARRHETEDPFTYRGIREYEPGDEIKRVNWKATAKTGELLVNERDYTKIGNVHIFLNLEDNGIFRRPELLEMSISICASLTRELLLQGIRVSIYANAADCVTGQLLSMEELTHGNCMDAVYRALARLDLEENTEKFGPCMKEKLSESGSCYTVFISPDRHEDYLETMRSYKQNAGKDFCWICPVKSNSEKKPEEELAEQMIFIVEEPS